MTRLRVAVIGGGHLGTIHARLLQQVPAAELVAIVEPDPSRALELGQQFDCPIATDVTPLIDATEIDAAILAAPTTLHHPLGMQLLERGIHTLIEKPLAPTNDAGRQLVAAAERAGCVLQVGHVERFNPVWSAFVQRAGEPRFIDAVREGPLTFRSMDAGVVLDLMIHDIDLILSWVQAPVIAVQALGFNWTGPAEDVAQARLTFANGCVAHIRASRVSSEPQRQLRAYGHDWYSLVDFGDRSGFIVHGPRQSNWQSRDYTAEQRQRLTQRIYDEVLAREVLQVPEANPILDEQVDFVNCIANSRTPVVSGGDGVAAVEIANQVIQRIAQRVPSAATYRPPERRAG